MRHFQQQQNGFWGVTLLHLTSNYMFLTYNDFENQESLLVIFLVEI